MVIDFASHEKLYKTETRKPERKIACLSLQHIQSKAVDNSNFRNSPKKNHNIEKKFGKKVK